MPAWHLLHDNKRREKRDFCDCAVFSTSGTWAEVQKLTLTNTTGSVKKIKVFLFVDWCLWNAASDMENFQRNFSTGEAEIEDSVIYPRPNIRKEGTIMHIIPSMCLLRALTLTGNHFSVLYNGLASRRS